MHVSMQRMYRMYVCMDGRNEGRMDEQIICMYILVLSILALEFLDIISIRIVKKC